MGRADRRVSGPLSILLATVLVLAFPAAPVEASDWDIPNGHFFTQTGGYSIVDQNSIPFWTEFQRLGGVQAVGYPVSRRFQMDGFTVQAMQRVIFQWRPEVGQVYFINVFDRLSQAGKDGWLLTVRSTPKPLPPDFDQGKSWGQIMADRLALLEENQAIKKQYFSVVGDPVAMNGLPTSRVTDMGNHYALRAQRVVLQQWKETVPWASTGEVTVALGGSIAAEAGLLPREVLVAERLDPPALALINSYRAAAGVPPARLNPSLMKAAEGHVAYYDANQGRGMAGMGLHFQRIGLPGFTGVSFGDRARAAGYSSSGMVTENAGFGSMEAAINWHMDTVNHRLPLIHPNAQDMGYAVSPASGFNIIDVGLPRQQVTVPLPSVYPPDKAVGVPRSWDSGESPDPAPGVPRPVGYPITIAFSVTQRVEWKGFELRNRAGEQFPIVTAETAWMRANAIIPLRPLQPGETYTVRVSAVVDGKPVTKQWSFTTG